ncbi:MAG: MoaD/ThiS family protein [Pseudomonadales bacterium]
MEVQLSGTLRDAAGGASSIELEAKTIRELMRKIEERYPKMAASLADEVAVSINGQIFRDNWGQEIPADAEVFLLPRIPGG